MRFPVFLLCLLPLAAAWSYDDTDSWVDEYPTCGGYHQSPISVNLDEVVPADLPALKFQHYDERFSSRLVLTNNGHTIEFAVPTTVSGAKPTLSGGLLNGNYTAEAVHFHWGSSNEPGSEHEFDGNRLAMEMHIVHKNSKYASVSEAREFEDGLAVVGVLFHFEVFSKVKVPGIDYVAKTLPSLKEYSSTAVASNKLTLGSLLGQVRGKPYITGEDFLTYSGSLTTPPCSESVTWHLFTRTLPISPSVLYEFSNIEQKNGVPLTLNYRHVQPIGDRQVYSRSKPVRNGGLLGVLTPAVAELKKILTRIF